MKQDQIAGKGSAMGRKAREIFLSKIVGQSALLRAEVRKVPLYANSDDPVIITGETGTGKEIFAEAIHHCSPRAAGPLVAVNCAAIPPELVEDALFGHVAGAFTTGFRATKGFAEQAEGGTLFLDEVDCLSLAAQAKVLRFALDHTYQPIGAETPRQANLR